MMNKKIYLILVLVLILASFGLSYNYAFKHANPFTEQVIVPESDFELGRTRTDFETVTDQLIISTYYTDEEFSVDLGIDNIRYLNIAVHSKNNIELYGGETPQQAIESEPIIYCVADSVCSFTPDSIEKYYVINGDGKINVRTIAANSLEDEENLV